VNKNKFKFRSRQLIKNDDGLSNIVTSIMMLGILLSIVAMIFTVYVPIMAKTDESNHMEKVESSFLGLKSTIDRQIADDGGVGSTFSTRIKLGNEGGIFFGIGRTSGTLDFKPDQFNFVVTNTNDTGNLYGSCSGKVSFTSENNYYTNQNFHYESGAIIIEQEGSSVLRTDPDFGIFFDELTNKTTLVTTLIQLSGEAVNKGGTDYHIIKSKLIESISESHKLVWTSAKGFDYGQNLTINITTRFGPLWKTFLESELDNLPESVKNATTQLTITSHIESDTKDRIYNILLNIDNVAILDLKKGIVEIDLN